MIMVIGQYYWDRSSLFETLQMEFNIVIVKIFKCWWTWFFLDSTDHKPTESLLIKGHTFEEQAASFITDVFQPLGFIVKHFTRLPYLCEGDMHKSFYVLNDAIFVLSLNENG